MSGDFLSNHQIVSALYPVADAFDTATSTDYVSLDNYGRATFVIHTGNATGNTANGVVTVYAATAAQAAANTGGTAMAFKYRVCASSTTVDTWGALTDATSSGFTMTTGDNYVYAVEVNAEDVAAALADATYVKLTVTEGTNDPIDAGVLVILSDARYPGAVPVSAL